MFFWIQRQSMTDTEVSKSISSITQSIFEKYTVFLLLYVELNDFENNIRYAKEDKAKRRKIQDSSIDIVCFLLLFCDISFFSSRTTKSIFWLWYRTNMDFFQNKSIAYLIPFEHIRYDLVEWCFDKRIARFEVCEPAHAMSESTNSMFSL